MLEYNLRCRTDAKERSRLIEVLQKAEAEALAWLRICFSLSAGDVVEERRCWGKTFRRTVKTCWRFVGESFVYRRRWDKVGVDDVFEGGIFHIFDGMNIYIFVGVKLFVDGENLFVDGEKFHVCSVGVGIEFIGWRFFDEICVGRKFDGVQGGRNIGWEVVVGRCFGGKKFDGIGRIFVGRGILDG